MKAVVASSRLGSAGTSHSNISESQKLSQIHDAKEDVQALPGEKMPTDGALMAVEGAEVPMTGLDEEVKDADINTAEASEMVSEAREDGTKVAMADTNEDEEVKEEERKEKGLVIKSVEEAKSHENLAPKVGAQQNDAVLPEY